MGSQKWKSKKTFFKNMLTMCSSTSTQLSGNLSSFKGIESATHGRSTEFNCIYDSGDLEIINEQI